MKRSEKFYKKLHQKYGPWAVITGASSGIGKALAIELASAGFHLVLHGRNESELNKLAQRLSNENTIQTMVVAADLTKSIGLSKLLSTCDSLPIGLFIASAGFGTSGKFLNASLHEEINLLKVNCEALLELTYHFSHKFTIQKRGGIILLSSMVAFQGVPYSANYAASKAYVQSLAEALHVELKAGGVDVLAAAPGPVMSGFSQRANMQMNMYLTPKQIVLPILKALGKQRTVLPGFLTKFLVYSLRTVPRWGKVLIMKQVMKGMTKHQSLA